MNSLIAPYAEKALSWWQSISQREQRLVAVSSVLVVIAIVYWGIFQPLNVRAEQAEMRLSSERQLLSWVQDKADSIVSKRGSGSAPVSSQPLNQVINSSARQFQIELIRVQPRGDMLQVWVKPLSFDQFINWLTFLQEKQGVEVAFLDIEEADKPGVIDINRLQFSR